MADGPAEGIVSPRHATYRNVPREEAFTVTCPRSTQVVMASLAASAHEGVAAHAHRDAPKLSERDDQRLIHESPLLAYIDPGRFAAIGESDPVPFPAGFLR